MPPRDDIITYNDIEVLLDAMGAIADLSGDPRLYKLEKNGYLRVVNSYDPRNYTNGFDKPVKVYTFTESGAALYAANRSRATG